MKPLAGILVVAIEQAVAAPLCTARLADAGARIIKIERPGGDFARLYDTAAKGESSYFTWLNHGKQSLVLDFKQPDDAALLRKLVTKADVLVQNLAPGALERAGFGIEQLRTRHPSLITCTISGYGDASPMQNRKAYDLLVQAESGLVEISGGPGEPGRIGISLCDIGAGITAHAAILEALILRQRTCKGTRLSISLFDVAAEWMSVPYIHQVHGAGAHGRAGLHHPSIAPYGAYETGDGKKTILSIQNEREWQRLCAEVLDDAMIAVDSRFSSNNNRVENRTALDGKMDKILQKIDANEFRTRLQKADIAYAGMNNVDDLARHPALCQRGIVNARGIETPLPAHPVRWPEQPDAGHAPVPELGQHSQEIRREFAS